MRTNGWGPARLRHQDSHNRGGRMLRPEGQRRLSAETTVLSGRRTARYSIDPSSPLQGLQISTPTKSLDLQILQRTLEVPSHNLSCPVRLFRKALMFVTSVTQSLCGTIHALLLSYDLSRRPSVTQRCGERMRKPCHV